MNTVFVDNPVNEGSSCERKVMNAVITILKTTILTLVGCVALAFALDNTIKGTLIMDILLVAAYIVAIVTAWIICKEDGRIGSLPVAAVTMTVAFGAEIWMLITDINVAISRWSDLSGLPDPGRWNSTMLAVVLACVPLLLITLIKPSSPKRNDGDNKG